MSEPTTPPPGPSPSGKPPKAADFSATRDWPSYFQCMLGKPPRETLALALDLFDKDPHGPRRAVDLGCGEGRDAFEILRRGWSLTAIDGHPLALELLESRVPPEHRPRLTTQLASFSRASWGGEGGCDLLNASFALPFCPPDEFPALWARIRASIRPGGRFAGQLFGDRDSWAGLPDRTHHPRSALDGLFEGFLFEDLREDEKLDTDCAGAPKHWHVYHIVARRRP